MDSLNFLPDDYLQKKTQQRLNYIYLILLLVIFTGLVGSISFLEKKRSRINHQIGAIEQQIDTTQALLTKYETLQARREQLLQKASLSSALTASVPQSLLLACLTNNLTETLYLTHYEMITRQVAVAVEAPEAKNKVNKKTAAKAGGKSNKKGDAAAEFLPPRYTTSIEILGNAKTDYDVATFVENLNQSQIFHKVYLHYVKEEKEKGQLRSFKISAQLHENLTITPEIITKIKGQSAVKAKSSGDWLNRIVTTFTGKGTN